MTERIPRGVSEILLLLALVLTSTACAAGSSGDGQPFLPRADGVLDLTAVDLSRSGLVSLAGQWDFIYGRHVPPGPASAAIWNEQAVRIRVPATWKGFEYAGRTLSGTGIASYRLTIRTDGTSATDLALLLPGWETAYRLFVNGREVATTGIPGSGADDTVAAWIPRVVPLGPVTESLELVLHLSNFAHARGGPAMTPHIGTVENVRSARERGVSLRLLAFGSLAMISFYHLVIFLLRRRDTGALFFSLFCLALALRSLVVEEQSILLFFPAIPWGLQVRLAYLALAFPVSFFTLFVRSLYPRELPVAAARAIAATGFIYAAIIVVTPPVFFTALVLPFQGILIAVAIYCFVILAVAAARRREGATLFVLAFLVVFLAMINDVLYHRNVISTGYVVPVAFLVFVSFQAVILARRYAAAFAEMERLIQQKILLEDLSYRDPLTGVANRRRLSEYLETEWQRGMREGNVVSCIMIDIDFFKKYNDSFGHPAGDEVLRRVAQAVQACIHRPADLIARYGGEEFAVLLPGTEREGAHGLSERIRAAIQEMEIPAADQSVAEHLTVSVGHATMDPRLERNPLHLVRQADEALYAAKEGGRNQVR